MAPGLAMTPFVRPSLGALSVLLSWVVKSSWCRRDCHQGRLVGLVEDFRMRCSDSVQHVRLGSMSWVKINWPWIVPYGRDVEELIV